MFNIQKTDLRKLNSLTKYPSIPTYHVMGNKGELTDELSEDFSGKPVFTTEKVDGTNSRIVFTPDGSYVIGSREELLHAKGDLIFNPVLDIVETVRPLADKLLSKAIGLIQTKDALVTIFVETYGGKIGSNAKQYTSERQRAFRLFDIALTPIAMCEESVEAIAIWRENKGQLYLDRDKLSAFAEANDIEMVPDVHSGDGSDLPRDIKGMLEFLQTSIPETRVALDSGAKGRPEGLVLRTADRKQIAKIRFEDYERTMKRQAKSVS